MQQFLSLKKTPNSFEEEQSRPYHYRHRSQYHYYNYYSIIIITILIIIITKIWTDMSEIFDSLTCAHPTHHLAILQDFSFFYPFLAFIRFFTNFLCNLTGSRRNIGLACIINALLLPQTVLLKCSTTIRGSAARYSWETQISCLSLTDPNF